MRRAECIQWPPCQRPDVVSVRNKEDYGHRKPYLNYQARSQLIMSDGHDVLNVDIFNGFGLAARYFADATTGSHTAMIMETGEWKKCILQNVVNICAGKEPFSMNEAWTYCGCDYEKFAWATEEDKKRAYRYVGPLHYSTLESWESDLQRKKREKQLQNKLERINIFLDGLTPQIPEDFYRWMHEEIFGKKYLFQHKDKVRKAVICRCGACKEEWEQEKAVGIGPRICPKCGAVVHGTYREEETAAETLFLLQPCSGGQMWIERVLRANCTWTPGEETFVTLDEQIRHIIRKGKSWGDCYYEDYIDRDGNPMFWDTNPHSLHTKAGYLYPGTLEECRGLWPKSLCNAGLPILAGNMVKANYNYIITSWHQRPWFEYLVKGGFFRLIIEIAAHQYGYPDKSGLLNDRGKNMQEVFRIDKSRIDRLRQIGGNFRALNWLQYEQNMGQKISAENMTFLMKHFHPDTGNVVKALNYVKSANVFANYVRKQAKLQGMTPAAVLSDWNDYLDMAMKQGLNLSHEIFYKPRNLKEAHDACVREARLQEGRKKAEGILEKFPDVEKNMDAVRDKYTYVGEQFCIMVPEGIPDIIHEGRALGHCIDTTDRYFDRINQNISYLVFLRRRSAPTVPYYTLEIEPGGTIRQQRTTGNNQNKKDVEEYAPFIREWQGEVRKRLTESDRAAAKNSRNVRLQEYRELREKKEKVWHGKLAGTLLADVLEADLIENVI